MVVDSLLDKELGYRIVEGFNCVREETSAELLLFLLSYQLLIIS
jgi:hypothetical protein